MKRIAMISEHASPVAALGGVNDGGQNVYVGQVARHLQGMGYGVDIFTRRDDPQLPTVMEWLDGVRIIHVDAGPPAHIPKEDLFPFMDQFARWMMRFIRQQGHAYRLVHANFWMSGHVAIQLKRHMGLPFVVTFHALGRVRRQYQGEEDRFPDERFAVEEQIIAEAARVIAECPQDVEDLSSLYNAPPEKLEIIPCGYDPAEMWPVDKLEARRYLGLPRDEAIVLQLGRMVPRKGIDNVIRAVGRLNHIHKLPAWLVIVGGEEEVPVHEARSELERLARIARREKILERVIFAGQKARMELKYFYSAADVFVSTPWYEPFGITPLEAMACGTPVVGSDVGGIKYTVADGETGRLVPPNQPDRLAAILAELLSSPGTIQQYGRNSIQRVREHFTWNQVARSIARLYQQTLNGVTGAQPEVAASMRMLDQRFEDALQVFQQTRETLIPEMVRASEILLDCLQMGGRVLVCGNGGSAADAQHFAAELVGRFVHDGRAALPVIALSADSAILTAWANDYSFDEVFSRQVEAYGKAGDVLLAISTSGNSVNVLRAVNTAQQKGMEIIVLSGGTGGRLANRFIGANLLVPSTITARIQEAHIFLLHMLSELVEEDYVRVNTSGGDVSSDIVAGSDGVSRSGSELTSLSLETIDEEGKA